MKKVYICGFGNMGKRYAAILDILGVKVATIAVEHSFIVQRAGISKIDDIEGIIIATPTYSHYDAIYTFSETNLPILCEKPFIHGVLNSQLVNSGKNIRMVNQYEYLQTALNDGLTRYNYFKTGNDGLFWDCINIIGLANGTIELDDTSPIWSCQINGEHFSIADMDQAYIDMLDHWTLNPEPNLEYADEAHEKTAKIERLYQANGGIKRFNPTLMSV